jgi:hypothetical protein
LGGQKYIVSLKPEDVTCFVFWSKNFTPFLDNLNIINDLGYKFYFNYTVTGLPSIFEHNVNKESAIKTLKLLSKIYSPGHINWRFDPIIISNICDRDFYINAFGELAFEFGGLVQRCYFSFVTEYNKVKHNLDELERRTRVKIIHTNKDFKIELASELAEIAEHHGIQMYSCCGDYLLSDKIKKAHCVDGSIVESLFSPVGLKYEEKPTRRECGCTESMDIGTYDTCPHGCVYCYANANKEKAYKAFTNYDKDSAFLGFRKCESDNWLTEVKYRQNLQEQELFE